MTLDFGTLQLASITSRLAYVVVFLITLLRQPKEVHLGAWAAALVASLIASFLMVGIPSTAPLAITRGLAVYALYGTSLALSLAGLRLFYQRSVALGHIVLLSLFPGLAYALLLGAGASMAWSLTSVFAGVGCAAGLCAFEILRTPSRQRLWTQYIVASGFGCFFLVFMLSILLAHVASDRLSAPESGIYSLLVDQGCGVFIQVGYLAMVSERANLRVTRLAETDPLTGLANRRGLLAAIGEQKAPRRTPVAVLLCDIDRFKAINDTHGHHGGDAVLVGFANRLEKALRKGDVLARWGGEEFLAVLPDTPLDEATAVAERLREAIAEQPFGLPVGTLAVTVSIGVGSVGDDDDTLEDAIGRADVALYAAKSAGRNRVRRQAAASPGGAAHPTKPHGPAAAPRRPIELPTAPHRPAPIPVLPAVEGR